MDRRALVFAAIGFECVGLVTVLVLLGRYLDQHYGWNGMGVVSGAFLAIVSWVTHVIYLLKDFAKNTKPE